MLLISLNIWLQAILAGDTWLKKIFVQGIRWPTGDQGAEIVPVQFIHANTVQIGWQR